MHEERLMAFGNKKQILDFMITTEKDRKCKSGSLPWEPPTRDVESEGDFSPPLARFHHVGAPICGRLLNDGCRRWSVLV
jgi:hypothetical protein